MFRVTSNTLFRNSLRDIQSTAEAFARAQQQVSSGQRLQQASDDPAAATIGLRERAEIRAVDRYREASDSVDSRLRVTDTDARTTEVKRGEIDELRPSGTSIMPVGMAGALGEQKLRDLITFLTTQPTGEQRPSAR